VRQSAPSRLPSPGAAGRTEPSALLDQPLQQRPGETLTPCLGRGREVIDVQVMAPGEVVANTESSDRAGGLTAWREGAEEPVASGSQHTIDMLDELLLAFVGRSQCAHRLVGEHLEDVQLRERVERFAHFGRCVLGVGVGDAGHRYERRASRPPSTISECPCGAGAWLSRGSPRGCVSRSRRARCVAARPARPRSRGPYRGLAPRR
jgi:hypothetical protein